MQYCSCVELQMQPHDICIAGDETSGVNAVSPTVGDQVPADLRAFTAAATVHSPLVRPSPIHVRRRSTGFDGNRKKFHDAADSSGEGGDGAVRLMCAVAGISGRSAVLGSQRAALWRSSFVC